MRVLLNSRGHVLNFAFLNRCILEIVLRSPRGCTQIGLAHDVVAVEDVARLVPAFTYAGSKFGKPRADETEA